MSNAMYIGLSMTVRLIFFHFKEPFHQYHTADHHYYVTIRRRVTAFSLHFQEKLLANVLYQHLNCNTFPKISPQWALAEKEDEIKYLTQEHRHRCGSGVRTNGLVIWRPALFTLPHLTLIHMQTYDKGHETTHSCVYLSLHIESDIYLNTLYCTVSSKLVHF